MSTTNGITTRAYTTKELSALYGVSAKTLRTWLHPYTQLIGEKRGRYFNALQVKLIFEKLGIPE